MLLITVQITWVFITEIINITANISIIITLAKREVFIIVVDLAVILICIREMGLAAASK